MQSSTQLYKSVQTMQNSTEWYKQCGTIQNRVEQYVVKCVLCVQKVFSLISADVF